MSSIEVEIPASPAAVREPVKIRSIIGGVIGNLVEWYDWYIYPAFALYFSKAFFPQGDQTAQLLNAAAVFAIGFLMRPIGSWLMGIYGDSMGRRAALKLSMIIMAIASLCIGLIPGYDVIGIWAAISLIVLRMIQGLSLGGQYGSSATYLSEIAPENRRGFWSSFHYSTLLLGHVISMSTLLVLQFLLSPEELQAWGWRVPFLFGFVLSLGGLFIILQIEETASFEAVKRKGEPFKPWKSLIQHPKELGIVFGLTASATIAYQTYSAYMPKYLVNTSGFSPEQAAQLTAFSIITFIFMQPVMGWISDIVGRRAMMIAYACLGLLFTYPLLSALSQATSMMNAYFILVAGLFCLSPYSSVSALFKSELFPAKIRATAVGLSFSLAVAIFGGTSEVVALSLKQAGVEHWFYIYITAGMGVALIIAILMPDTKQHSRMAED